MRKIIITLLVLFAIIALVLMIQDFYTPTKKISYKYSPTDFIEPDGSFIKCYRDDDCIKIKGSACPPSSGGSEVCVNKNYFQEYISEIEKQAGKEWEVMCPEIYLASNKTCSCIENKCILT